MSKPDIVVENREGQHRITATAVHVEWERIFLKVDVQIEGASGTDTGLPLTFYAVNGNNRAKAVYRSEKIGEGLYRLCVNITNCGSNRCFPDGSYRICVCAGTEQLATVMPGTDILNQMADFSRIFLYHNGASAYNVLFHVAEGEGGLQFLMNVTSMSGNTSAFPGEEKKCCLQMISSLKKCGKAFCRSLLKTFYKCCSRIRSGCANTILFMTEQNDSCGSNQMAVYHRMQERGLDKKYTLLLSARRAASQRQSLWSWLVLIRKIAMSRIVILDDHAPIFDWMKLNNNTQLVQMWHAGAGFKSSGYSRWGHKGCPAPQSCHRQYTYGIAGSRQIAPFFSEVWGIMDEQVLPTGMPRMDEYLNEENRRRVTQQLYAAYPMCREKKVVLFAPTYRGKNRKTAYYPYHEIDFKRLWEACDDRWVVLFKMHPWVNDAVPIPEEYRDKFLDVGEYPNINDLFYITDLLITDYSSNIFEYSLMRKPMMFFAFDKVQYSFSRGFHRDYEESAPGKICYTFGELMDAFEKEDFEYEKVEEYVKKHFDYTDTHSSDRFIDWIILGQIPEDLQQTLTTRREQEGFVSQLKFTAADSQELLPSDNCAL